MTTEFKYKTKPENTYIQHLAMLQALPAETLRSVSHRLSIAYITPSLAARLIAKKLESNPDLMRLVDTAIHQPVTVIELPENGEQIVREVVSAYIKEKGILVPQDMDILDAEGVTIPTAIPDCFGYYEAIDPACGDCVYNGYCQDKRAELEPKCYRLAYNSNSPNCVRCLYSPWCSQELQP